MLLRERFQFGSMARRSSKTDMHSAKTVRPESVRPSCGRYPAEVPLATIEGAVVERVHAGENFHQRGFAGAVAADQADAVVGRDQPVRVFEEKFVAEAFSGAGKLNHGTGIYRLIKGAACATADMKYRTETQGND